MAKINFPASPVNGQTYNQNGVYYTYDSTLGAWVTALVSKPYDASKNTQIIFNDAGFANGSNGMTYNKSSNTAYFNNVSASYYTGNGSLLTGVASDLSPAYNTANAAFNAANNAGISVTAENLSSLTYYPVLTTTTSGAAKANVANTKLYFVPSTGTLSATVFNSLSDITLKTDIEGIDGLEILNNMNPVSFRWKDNGNKSYGVIAQELEQQLPELVETNDQGIKSVSYIPMIAILIDVVKKQQKEIDQLKTLLNTK